MKTLRGRRIETLISWVRDGRMRPSRAIRLSDKPFKFILHMLLSPLPITLHRALTDMKYLKSGLSYIFVRPVRLLLIPAARHAWLVEMVEEGKKNHMLTESDADEILSKIDEPFVQKYLKSLAVHVCTLPITQIVSLACATVYIIMNWGSEPFLELFGKGWLIVAVFQVTPVSPGSLVRGLYVLYLVIRERNFKDYNIAVFLGFFKYVGYLAFPIQMAYRYPALARFMAAHWATGAVHVVPVFGEHGALMEHSVFDLFYNYPLTVRRRIIEKTKRRQQLNRYLLPAIAAAIAGGALLVGLDVMAMSSASELTASFARSLSKIWYAVILVPFFVGWVASATAGGMRSSRRIAFGALTGVLLGIIHTAGNTVLVTQWGLFDGLLQCYYDTGLAGLWRMFLFALFALVGAVVAETRPGRKSQ
ncbi:MAG TPA: hypothetical protein ENL03_02810 [Phycisphaerae bacterium]|nr:hypothetical protein [Phycisphaerae bacterium]